MARKTAKKTKTKTKINVNIESVHKTVFRVFIKIANQWSVMCVRGGKPAEFASAEEAEQYITKEYGEKFLAEHPHKFTEVQY